MERNYMRPDALVELEFITDTDIQIHWHENFELIFVISGKLKFAIEEDMYQLGKGDIIVVNTNRKHSYMGTKNLVLGRFVISYNKVRELLGLEHVLFWCNSTADRNEAYDALRRIISKVLNQSINRGKRSKLYLNSLYYQMLHILTENFVLTPNDKRYEERVKKSDDRILDIFSFIRNNYRQNISLEDISQQFYLSTTYISKYIKKKCGINFIELLNSVRLSHAMEDMMYSDDSIMKIALENGFANVAAFNKVFKNAFHQTPSQFRRQHKAGREMNRIEDLKRQELIHEKVEQYLQLHPGKEEESEQSGQINIQIDRNTMSSQEWDYCACRMINIGTAIDILNANIQQQILDNQEQMGFLYVRFWDIYNPQLYLDIHSPDGKQNFSRIDDIIDFLVEHQLRPYLELGFKGRRILRTMEKEIIYADDREDFFESEDEMERFYRSLFGHFIRRYGSWEVSGWYFEYWEKPVKLGVKDSNITLRYADLDEKQHENYFRQFNIIARALREQLPEAKIGGAGFPVRVYGKDIFTKLLLCWKGQEQKPDFISLSCYPYSLEKERGDYYEKRLSDLNFVRYGIETAKKSMEEAGFLELPIHVTEYSLSLSSRNVLNDSCLKAAWLLNNAIECMGKTKMLGQFFFTDAFAQARDTDAILFGGNGYLTKDGILKPSYYSIEFLSQLYPTVLEKHSNYLITKNERGSLRFVCHNLKKPNYNYYLMDEDALDIRGISDILNDREYLQIHLSVTGMKDGVYIMKTHVLNSHHGSIQDKWIDMNMESELTRKEMNYIRFSSMSDISIKEVNCVDGCISIDMDLEPNEIRYVHIYRK